MIALLLLAWMLIALAATYGTYLYWSRVARKLDAPFGEGVAVLIPIKGASGQKKALERFLAACLAQRGVAYRLIFAVESDTDPAAAPIARLATDNAQVSLVVAGRATRRSQKIHNQLAALATLRPDDRFVVFADADMLLAEDWLAQLLRPLLLGRAELASGYRWILPADDRLASRFCALMDWSVATAARSRRWNLCWGGSIAITRAALERIDLPRLWDRAMLDDLVLTGAARRAGIAVHAPHQVLVASPVRHDVASLFSFGRRQYIFARVHARRHWVLAGVTLAVPVLSGGVAIVASLHGDPMAMVCIVIALGLQQLRAQFRLGVARRVLPVAQAAASAALLRRDRWKLPAAHLVHLAIWMASAVGDRMIWAGITYRLPRSGIVRIVGRVERAKGIEPS